MRVQPLRSLRLNLFLLLLNACGGADNETVTSGANPDEARDAGPADGAAADPPSTGISETAAFPTVTSIEIEPAMVELVSVDGSRPEQEFVVIGTFSDGHTQQLNVPVLSLVDQTLGAITPNTGRFIASGIAGGVTMVKAEISGRGGETLTADAQLSVRIERVLAGAGVPEDANATFQATAIKDGARAANLVYPLEGAVMPQNVFPADVQWLNGAAGDLFEISLTKPSVKVVSRIVHTGPGFGNHYLVDTASWRALAQSEPDMPVTLTVRRYDSAKKQLIDSEAVRFSFARAALTGSIYYWDIAAGRIVRIDDGTNVGVQFMPSPQQGCVGCHSVSPSGRYMAGRLGGGDNFGTVFDLTADLTPNPPPVMFSASATKWWFSSWSPDETRLVVSRGNGSKPSLAFIDPFTGADVPTTGTMPSNATQPAWSPDGKEIAYVADGNNWGDHAVAGNIAVLPVKGPDSVGAVQTIHAGTTLSTATPGGKADSYPCYSPDSKLITFTHGTGVRSDDQQGALYLMGRDGGSVRRLDKACGGVSTKDNYQSRFSPFDSKDYFWISFLSKRDYGNAEVGTRGANRQQIWVAAIKKNAAPTEDPSEVAYWLPGQSPKSQNISAYWAPRACRKDGDSCAVGSECCGGDCRPNDQGALVCAPPPPEACRVLGQTCSSGADCCDGASCLNNVCTLAIE